MKALFLAFLLLLAPAAQTSVLAAEPPLARMDEVLQSYMTSKLFMGTVLIVKGDDVILDKAYGSADLEWDIPNTTATKFRIGSITKQFTAASIMLLEERGKLKLADPIGKHLPELPAAWHTATIAQILNHTSGIYSYTSLPDGEFMRWKLTHAQVIDRIKDKPLDFAPGEKYSYSNTGYFVLGMLIEKLSGQTYDKFLQDNIFTPLKMTDSGYDTEAAVIPRRARGYQRKDGVLINTQFLDMTIPYAAGSLYSTTHDLLTWNRALFAGKVVTPASFKKMTTPAKDNYGFGLGMAPQDGHRSISHGGGINGFTSSLATFPDDKLTVIVLNNAQGPTGEIAAKLATLMFGKPVTLPSERKEVTLDAKILARYVGRYELRPNFVLEITSDGKSLTGQATKQPPIAMFAEDETNFFTRTIDSQVTFVVAGDGPASALVLHQGGRDMTAKRIP
jgi:CubicO group peptidase (beta-lactamase class C family)